MEQIACVLADVRCPISFVARGKVRQPSHLVPGPGAQVRYSLATNVNTPFFQAHTRKNSDTVPVPEYQVETLYSGTKVGTGPLCAHRVCYFCGHPPLCDHSKTHVFLKMASDREKWSNYAHSCMSGTQGTHAVVPSLKFIRLLRVVFSSQQRLNRPAVNAVQ